jgi:CRISPR system Cascade subunit CasA
MSFNLTEKPWIPVVSQDWQRQEVSLIELFSNWTRYRELQAENPPTTLALHRFLIAILHRAYDGPKDEEHWAEIRDDDGGKAIEYLQSHADKFDLFHDEYPFMQDLKIEDDAAGEVYQSFRIHGNNTSTVFCHEHQWSQSAISIAAGARLLIRLQMFDVGGKKTGATESAGVIPTMDAVNILVKGKTLRDTLMLNLMQYDREREIPSATNGEDLPSWECPLLPATNRIPNGYISYLTYRWRRCRLFIEDENVVKAASHPGDKLPKELSPQQWEYGIPYRKNKKGDFPVRLNLNRSLWRDADAFLQSSEAGDRPRILDWVADLKAEDAIDDIIHLQILGLTVDNAKPLGWDSSQFSAPVIYLKNKNKNLWQSLSIAIRIAEEHQQVFKYFKGSPYSALAEALKNGDAGKIASSLNGESRYWATLDREFQILLAKLPEDKKVDDDGTTYGIKELPIWTKIVQNAARRAFTDSIASIRNYEARAKALRSLEYYLAKLRGEVKESKAKKKAKKDSESQQLALNLTLI